MQQAKQDAYLAITSRFISNYTEETPKGSGELAAKCQVRVQNHYSESNWEYQFAQKRFGKNDAQALSGFGLLVEKAVMAYVGFLKEVDINLFHEIETVVTYCPISNAYFGNAVIPITELVRRHQVEVDLGNDLSGSFSLDLFDNLEQAVISSRMLEDGVNAIKGPEVRGVKTAWATVNEASYLTTVGGGQALSLPIGRLERGYAWDVQIINTSLSQARILKSPGESLLDIFQKILHLARLENIREVWVQGEKVHDKNLMSATRGV